MTDGWAYFCSDTGNFYIDCAIAENTTVRIQLNANYAKALWQETESGLVQIDPAAILALGDRITALEEGVDDTLDAASVRPVQNKVIYEALENKSQVQIITWEDGD